MMDFDKFKQIIITIVLIMRVTQSSSSKPNSLNVPPSN